MYWADDDGTDYFEEEMSGISASADQEADEPANLADNWPVSLSEQWMLYGKLITCDSWKFPMFINFTTLFTTDWLSAHWHTLTN